MKISHIIFLGFFFILLLFSFTTYINYKQSEEVKENAEYFSKSSEIVKHSGRFQRNIINMVSGLRGYLLTGENFFIASYDSAALENQAILKDLFILIPNGSVQHKRLDTIKQLNNRWINEFALPLRRAKMEANASKKNMQNFNQLYSSKLLAGEERNLNKILNKEFKEFSNYEYESRETRRIILAESVRQTRNISLYLNSLSIICGFLIAAFLAYGISSKILKMVNMANSIAAGNYQVTMSNPGRDELGKLAESLNNMARILSENISQLNTKNEELDQFAHIVSHDLKAPLRGIDNVISWIEEDHSNELPDKVKEYLQMMKGRISRGENMIEGILSYARVGKEVHVIETVDTNLLVKEILGSIDLKPGLKIEVENELPAIHTERLPLLIIFSNLIGNASKYHNKPNGVIKIYHKNHPTFMEFFVEDNGPGIKPNHQEKIFQIFQTLQERDSFESTGVGLAIVKKILSSRKETINIASKPGQGSVFSFTWSKSNPNEENNTDTIS